MERGHNENKAIATYVCTLVCMYVIHQQRLYAKVVQSLQLSICTVASHMHSCLTMDSGHCPHSIVTLAEPITEEI